MINEGLMYALVVATLAPFIILSTGMLLGLTLSVTQIMMSLLVSITEWMFSRNDDE